ncbi:MAG: PQQ-binding-like beta-propeller repeat protein, partial [Pirellulales bacterium]|nr:PQQ-binding-like beta-propeller repeat protein [Pirellulales bacterium]
RAAQLVAEKQWAAAGNLLADVLARDEDALVRPAVTNPAASVTAEATRLIATLPKQGLAAYQLRVALTARRALQQAASTGSVDDLTAVVRRFPRTLESSHAKFLLGRRHLDGGRPRLAALYLESLVAQADVRSQFEPQLSMMLTVSLIQLGKEDAAKRTVADLARRYSDDVQMAGSAASMSDIDSTIELLASNLNGRPRATATDWAGFRGGPRRLAATTGEGPLMRPRWVCRFGEWFEDEVALEQMRQMRVALHDRNVAVLPSAYPLAIGNRIVFRVGNNVVCLDASSGKIRWTAGLEKAIDRRRGVTGSGKAGTESGDDLATQSWGNALAGRLSSDGRSVFAIEGRTLPRRERSTMTFGSIPSTSGGQTHRSNILVALDLFAEGRRRWAIDGSKQIVGLGASQTFFMGAPLPVGGRLYVVGEQGHKIRLLVFDAATGAPIWSLHLAELDPMQALSALRRVYGVTPSYADGILVCPTSAGAVVFVHLKSRSLIAGFKLTEPRQQYDASLARGIAGAALIRVLQQQEPHVRGDNYWWDDVALIAGERVLYTSPSDQKLRCLRLPDARQLWSYPPANPSDEEIGEPNSIAVEFDPLYVGGVVGERILVVCRSRVIALRLEDGKPAWEGRAVPLPAGGGAPSGRGLVSGKMFMLPMSNGQIAVIDCALGKLTGVAGVSGEPAPGNLIAQGDRIVSLSSEQIASYEKLEAADARLATSIGRDLNAFEHLIDKAELLHLQGSVDESLALLWDVYSRSGHTDVRKRLTSATLDAIESDPRRLSRYATQLAQLIDTPDDLWRMLAARMRAAQAGGDTPGACAAAMEMHDLIDSEPTLDNGGVRTSNEITLARRRWLRLKTR